jgi:hypothetical protein
MADGLKRSTLLVIVALVVSAFTHLWIAAGYPIDVDEGFYLGTCKITKHRQ